MGADAVDGRNPVSVPAPLPLARWAAIGALLLIEYLAVSLLFDSQPLRATYGWLGWTGEAANLGIIVLTAVVVLGRAPLEAEMAQLRERLASLPRFGPWAAGHAVVVAAFFVVSRTVLGQGLATAAHPRLLVTLWSMLASAAILTALGAAIPARAASAVLRFAARPAVVGLLGGAAAWAIARLTVAFWPSLARATLEATTIVLAPFARGDLYSEPENLYLGLGDFVVEVSAECSGVQGMGLIAVLTTAYVIKFRHRLRLRRAVAIIPLGVASAYLANIVRIAALVWVGSRVSPDVALGGFHSKVGWLLNCALALGLLTWVGRSRIFRRATADDAAEQDGDNPTTPYLAPLLVNIALLLVTGAGVASFDLLCPVRVFLVTTCLVWMLPSVRLADGPNLDRRLALVPVLLGVLVLPPWLALLRPGAEQAILQADFIEGLTSLSPPAKTVWLSMRVLGAVFVAPIAEELAFRGFLLRRLVRADFEAVPYQAAARRPLALLVSAAAFGAMHQSFWGGTLAGIIYGLALIPRGRLIDAITAHVVTNAFIVAYAAVASRWDLLA
jgi:exosortase E/protease (VPEID-CTERM system)